MQANSLAIQSLFSFEGAVSPSYPNAKPSEAGLCWRGGATERASIRACEDARLSEVRDDEVGVYYGEDPPVPIPNTEVKLISADDTWLETARKNRSTPTL